MNKKHFIPVVLIFILCNNQYFAQAQIYNLNHCLTTGLEKNFDIRIVKNQQTISDNNAIPGNAGYLPTIDAVANYAGDWANFLRQYPSDGTPQKDYNNLLDQQLDAGVYLNWTIFDGLRIQTNYKKLKELQEIGRLNTQLAIENLLSQICSQYYNFVQQNIRLHYLESAVGLSRERLRIVEAQYEIGAMSRLDFHQAKVDFNADSSRLVQQHETLFASAVSLRQLLNDTNMEESLSPADTAISLKNLPSKEILLQNMLQNNVFLSLSEKEISLNTLEIKNLQSENYPYIRLNAGYAYTFNRYAMATYRKEHSFDLTYGITLGIRIFDGMNRNRQLSNAKIALQTQKLEYDNLVLSVKSDFAKIWMAYNNNLTLIEMENDNLSIAQETYDIAIDRYKLGNLSGLELREAQNSLLEAEERYLQAVYNTKLCEISLLQISGQIKEYLKE